MTTTKHHPPHNPPAHPAPAPAAAPAPQAPAYVPLKWSYPFTSTADKDGNDAHSYFEALSNAEDGFYPQGANGIWHGGIHFGRETGHILKQENGFRAIADGEVVAYRLDSAYPVLRYEDGKSCLYSTGFVLVRHKLQLPPAAPVQNGTSGGGQSAPSGASSTAAPTSVPSAPPPADETLTFFSLYMHTLDWRGYKAAIDAAPTGNAPNATEPSPIKCMPYWKGERRYRVAAGASDTQREPTKFDFSFPDAMRMDGADGDLSMPGALDSSSPLKWLDPIQFPAGTSWADRFRLIDQQPAAAPKPKGPLAKGAQVYSRANGEAIGLLPHGSEVQLGPVSAKDKGWAQITKVLKGEPVGVVIGDPVDARAPTGWVKVEQFDVLIDPQPLDSVVVLDTPYPVAAGTVLGYLGEYQRYREATKLPPTPQRPVMHLEVFAGADLPAFIKKSQARAKRLPDKNAFLEISAGAMLVDVDEPTQAVDGGLVLKPVAGAGDGPWVKVQPTLVKMPLAPAQPLSGHGHAAPHAKHPKVKPEETSVGSPVWVERALAGKPAPAGFKAWSVFPLQVSNAKAPAAGFDEVYSRGELDKLGSDAKAQDDNKAHWWKVTVGTSDGNSRTGWVCDTGHKLVQSRSAWEWPGFELIDNTSVSLVDSFKRFLYVQELLFDGDKESFEPSALSVNGSALVTRLEKVVDRLGNNDGKVTANELARAQSTRWVAHAMSHLVVRYESEWGGDLSKWNSLSSLMKERKYIWQGELERIERLRWWDKVQGVQGLPKDPAVYHLHPVGLVGNFPSTCACVNIERFISEYRDRHSADFGWYAAEGSPKQRIGELNAASVNNLRTLMTGIQAHLAGTGDRCDVRKIAYMLATARVESYDFRAGTFFGPIDEKISYNQAEIDYGSGPTARRPEYARKMQNTAIGDGYKYRGRGLVQLTWKKNYQTFADILKMPLVDRPEMAVEWGVAIRIMVVGMENGMFTGKSLSDYINNATCDYRAARQIINRFDKANILAEYAEKFEKLLRETSDA